MNRLIKITLPCLPALALMGCSACSLSLFSSGPFRADSPIIVTDGSTHLRHKRPSGNDFDVSLDKKHATVKHDDYSVGAASCLHVAASTCPDEFSSNLVRGWRLQMFTSNDASGTPIETLTSSDNRTVTADFSEAVTPQPDAMTGGTDLAHSMTFRSAKFTNGNGHVAPNIVCSSTPPGTLCQLTIHYGK